MSIVRPTLRDPWVRPFGPQSPWLPLVVISFASSEVAPTYRKLQPRGSTRCNPQLRGEGGLGTRRKASVSDATPLRSDRSDLTRAPPSDARQAQQDARSSNSSRARSIVICVACPAVGPCLPYGRTPDRGTTARKYDARGPYYGQPDGNRCDAAMRRCENTMPLRNAIGEKVHTGGPLVDPARSLPREEALIYLRRAALDD